MSLLAEIVNSIRTFGIEHFGRYYSFYRAKVSSNDDPQNRGRIQITIPAINNDKPLQEWAIPVSGYAGDKYGQFFPPEAGDFVWVAFECGDINFPIYMGGWWRQGKAPDGFSKTRRGIRTKECELYFDDKEKVISVKTAGCEIKLDEAGKKVEIAVSGGDVKVTAANVILDADNIKCGGSASKKVLLDGDQHICVVTGAPVPTTSTASKTKAE